MRDQEQREDMSGRPEPTVWYSDGLRFACQRCGSCCRGAPGFVWVTAEEIKAIAQFLRMTEHAFAQTYLRKVGDHISLIEYANGDCALYQNGCKVYAARPLQCRTFPFWDSNLTSPLAWALVKKRCPGVGKGRLHTMREISSCL